MIYELLLPAEWTELETTGAFAGSADDLASGFLHCSSRTQVAATARRVFRADQDLVVLAIDTGALEGTVRWEPCPVRARGDGRHGVMLEEDVAQEGSCSR